MPAQPGSPRNALIEICDPHSHGVGRAQTLVERALRRSYKSQLEFDKNLMTALRDAIERMNVPRWESHGDFIVLALGPDWQIDGVSYSYMALLARLRARTGSTGEEGAKLVNLLQ